MHYGILSFCTSPMSLCLYNSWVICWMIWIVSNTYQCMYCMYTSLCFLLLITTMVLQYVLEIGKYLEYGIWWLALGVASSIGLGKRKWSSYWSFYSSWYHCCLCRISVVCSFFYLQSCLNGSSILLSSHIERKRKR